MLKAKGDGTPPSDPWRAHVDTRSQDNFVGMTPESLAREAERWPRTSTTPEAVVGLLAESRRLWVGGATTYANFPAASLAALQAAERALRLRMGISEAEKPTLGRMVRDPRLVAVLDGDLRRVLWFKESALHWRNKLAHPPQPIALTPGASGDIIRAAHDEVAMLYSGGAISLG